MTEKQKLVLLPYLTPHETDPIDEGCQPLLDSPGAVGYAYQLNISLETQHCH